MVKHKFLKQQLQQPQQRQQPIIIHYMTQIKIFKEQQQHMVKLKSSLKQILTLILIILN